MIFSINWRAFVIFIIGLKVFFSSPAPSLAVKQQVVNHLLYRVSEPLAFDDLKAMAATFDPIADTTLYKDGGAAATALMKELNDHRLLEQNHWFPSSILVSVKKLLCCSKYS